MNRIYRLFLYLVYFYQAETKELRQEAFYAAKAYYAKRPLRNIKNQFPRAMEYHQRREDFQYFQRAYKNIKCDQIAKERLALLDQR